MHTRAIHQCMPPEQMVRCLVYPRAGQRADNLLGLGPTQGTSVERRAPGRDDGDPWCKQVDNPERRTPIDQPTWRANQETKTGRLSIASGLRMPTWFGNGFNGLFEPNGQDGHHARRARANEERAHLRLIATRCFLSVPGPWVPKS
ncbi:hypothetical protein BCR44DRAFT_1434106 [Catenaria anguillulae PL171]|uniref:Uncharacterized protein n=1 Tax=Catenaria anguillulae PL171 TaxID=765915 RepID=A0A1Y2HLD5_9FUNG|nr:hypothetical protein BCR44DRAFT_1434106 [Catenaria anguillulae PL171]